MSDTEGGTASSLVARQTREIVLVQARSAHRDLQANIRRLMKTLHLFSSADIAVFPELFLSGYDLRNLGELAISRNSEEMNNISSACADSQTAAVFGFIERDGPRIYNSVAALDAAGELRGVYRKVNLFADEAEAFHAGNDYAIVELSGLRIGLLNCFDIEFPEPARSLAVGGAELLISVAANMAPYFDDHELASRARALDNRLPHIYVNAVGESGGLSFVGGSRYIRSDGSVAASSPGAAEDQMSVEVWVGDRIDDSVDYLRHLPPDASVKGARTPRT